MSARKFEIRLAIVFQRNMPKIRIAKSLLLVMFLLLPLTAQTNDNDTSNKKCTAKFKILFEIKLNKRPDEVGLDVALEPKYYTEQCINDFTMRIRARYREKGLVSVALFESKKDQIGWFHDYASSRRTIDRRRGNYTIDRRAGIDLIEYSSKKGNSLNEIRVDYASDAGQ